MFHLSILLDKFMLRLKEEIKKMYKEIYMQYKIENEKRVDEHTAEYFRERFELASEEVKKMHIAERMRENFRSGEKQKELVEQMLGADRKIKRLSSRDKGDKGEGVGNAGFI